MHAMSTVEVFLSAMRSIFKIRYLILRLGNTE